MKTLVIAEHDEKELKPSTLSTITAAKQLGAVDLLIAGSGLAHHADKAALIKDLSTVLVADDASLKDQLAEALVPVIMKAAQNYDAILAPASTFGKNLMPQIAALLDVCQLSDIIKIIDKDTYERPIYAGNAIATYKSLDAKKVITVRTTAFDACEAVGGSARIEKTVGFCRY